jgi:hypothetical protein
VGDNYAVVCKDFSEGWLAVALSLFGSVILLGILTLLFFTRPKDGNGKVHIVEDDKTNLRLRYLEESQSQINNRLTRMELMLDKLVMSKFEQGLYADEKRSSETKKDS